MDTWVTQPGYPVINVTRDYEKKTITVSQKRFLAKKPNETSRGEWWIPINYALQGSHEFENTTATDWLEPNKTLIIKNVKPDEWVIFNKQQTGTFPLCYFKATYDLFDPYLTDIFFRPSHFHIN